MFTHTVVFVLSVLGARSFYLPGIAPRDYEFGQTVGIQVNKLESPKTQLPYDFYKLPFCRPGNLVHEHENLGEIMSGDTIENSPYEITMEVKEDCKAICQQKYSSKELEQFALKIKQEYRVNFILDNLPAAQKYKTITTRSDGSQEEDFVYEKGFPLGFVTGQGGREAVYLNNHINLNVLYHTSERFKGGRIVGFEVSPESIQHEYVSKWDPANMAANELNCGTGKKTMIAGGDPINNAQVVWTYSVNFEPSNVRWASRWDAYLKMQDPQIHWFSILNSFMIVLFLTGMVAMILMRALHKDLRRFNPEAEPEEIEEQMEESGWKLLHGDAFRPPSFPSLFAAFIGSGCQVLTMGILTLVFAALGFLSPANRGALMTTLLLLYVFMGVFNGYTAARVYKTVGEIDWQRNTLMTACLYPGLNFAVFFVLNLMIWHEGSSGAIPFGTMFVLLVLWFGISVPLVYLGAYLGYKRPAIELPGKVNRIPRHIPEQRWYLNKVFATLVGGVLPFGAVFIEVFFIMTSVWLHRFYYMFGFLLLVFFILLITSAEITIVMTYFQLCAEDHEWWWRSIFTSGSSALYLFLYSAVYFSSKLNIAGFVPSVLYFGYMFLVCLAFFVITGTVGWLSTFLFVKTIFGAIKSQ